MEVNRRTAMGKLYWTALGIAGALAFPDIAFGRSKTLEGNIFSKYDDQPLLAMAMLIEGGGCTTKEKGWIGTTPFNRESDGRRYTGNSIKEALLKPGQYNCFDLHPRNRTNLRILSNPERYKPEEWEQCLELSKQLLLGTDKFNRGQTHFFRKDIVSELEQGKLKINPKRLNPIDSHGFKHQFYEEV